MRARACLHILSGLLPLLLWVISLPASAGAQELASRVDAILGADPWDRVHWGLLLAELETGEVLYQRNARIRFAPASNMKFPVTIAALARLGPDFRYETAFYTDAPPGPDGRISGDLVLPGRGDPTLGEPFHDSADAALEALADSLLAAGVREVGGALRIDASAWDSTSVPTGWLVGNLPNRAAATGGAFGIGMGELEIEITGGAAPGDPARVSWRPMGTGSFVESRIRTVGPGGEVEIDYGYLPESRRWLLEGTITPGARRSMTRAQRDPVRQAAHALYRAIEGRGIRIEGGVEVVWEREASPGGGCDGSRVERCPAMVRVAGVTSPTLLEITAEVMGASQNWIAEQLVRTLGAEFGEEGSWDEGFQVITETLVDAVGVDSMDLYFRDGSGLAGYNLVSPEALVAMLRWARMEPWGEGYLRTMAEPGRDRTTLQSRLPELRGRLFAKTGTITHTTTLSGYLTADDGRELVFVIFSNASNLPASAMRPAIDRITREFARP